MSQDVPDAFDENIEEWREKQKAKQKALAEAPAFSRKWTKAFIKKNSKRWVTFIHPEHGRVPAQCVEMKENGKAQPGNIQDFKCTLVGRSGKSIEVSLVESYVHFCDSREQAIEQAKES